LATSGISSFGLERGPHVFLATKPSHTPVPQIPSDKTQAVNQLIIPLEPAEIVASWPTSPHAHSLYSTLMFVDHSFGLYKYSCNSR
jgi:hypothetical protein